jgi:hypothetical protein
MFVVLRIILFVGAIFWLSPLRPGLRPEPRIVPKTLAEAGAHADLAGIERLIEALDMLPSRRSLSAAEAEATIARTRRAEAASGEHGAPTALMICRRAL